jgi:hypothetical protein
MQEPRGAIEAEEEWEAFAWESFFVSEALVCALFLL